METQTNTEDGFIAVNSDENDLRTLTVCNMTEQTESGIEMSRDNIIDLRAALWDAIRTKGIQENMHSEDALNTAYQDGWEHGAADATDHKDYDQSPSESIHDEWDKRYASGYDVGFGKIATQDEPPER